MWKLYLLKGKGASTAPGFAVRTSKFHRMSQLEIFLQEQRMGCLDGASQDFTIDYKRAAEKFATYGLAEDEFLLKFIQFGNIMAGSIDLKLGAMMQVTFTEVRDDFDLDALADRLGRFQLGAGDPMGHLVVGICARLQSRAPVRIVLECSRGTRTLVVGESVEWEPEKPSSSRSSRLCISQRRRVKVTDSTYRFLGERCVYVAIPITLNGTRLATWFPGSGGNAEPSFQIARLHFRTRSNKIYRRRISGEPTISDYSADLWIVPDLKREASIWFLKAGVLIEEIKPDLGVPGVVGFIDGEGLPTDFSTLKVRKDSEVMNPIKLWLRDQGAILLEQAISHQRERVRCAPREELWGFLVASVVLALVAFSLFGAIYWQGSALAKDGLFLLWGMWGILSACVLCRAGTALFRHLGRRPVDPKAHALAKRLEEAARLLKEQTVKR